MAQHVVSINTKKKNMIYITEIFFKSPVGEIALLVRPTFEVRITVGKLTHVFAILSVP